MGKSIYVFHKRIGLAYLKRAMGEMGLNLRFRARDIAQWQDPPKIVEGEKVLGGPDPSATQKTISALMRRLKEYQKWCKNQSLRVRRSIEEIESIEKSLGIK